ncbi:hypothetical protein ACHAWF_016029 [Thalassiosira exigua]
MPRKERVLRDKNPPDFSRGGTRGYPIWYRVRMIELQKIGAEIPEVLERSLRRWKNKRLEPFEMTGNKSTKGMNGHHRFLLAYFKKFYPQASCNECAVFVAIHSDDRAVFTASEVSSALIDMDMTMKRASTTAYQAFTPANIERHRRYWTYPSPAGIVDVPRRRLIDIDECAIELQDANENYGHAVRGMRVRKIGNYGRGAIKLTLILAIEPGDPELAPGSEGSIDNPRLWYRLSPDRATGIENYVDFLNLELMDYFGPNEKRRTLLHDNLSSHKANEVVDAVFDRGHQVICRVPYRPHEAPIEYAIDQFAEEVRDRWNVIKNDRDLNDECLKILEAKSGMGGFDKLFRDCGYHFDASDYSCD